MEADCGVTTTFECSYNLAHDRNWCGSISNLTITPNIRIVVEFVIVLLQSEPLVDCST